MTTSQQNNTHLIEITSYCINYDFFTRLFNPTTNYSYLHYNTQLSPQISDNFFAIDLLSFINFISGIFGIITSIICSLGVCRRISIIPDEIRTRIFCCCIRHNKLSQLRERTLLDFGFFAIMFIAAIISMTTYFAICDTANRYLGIVLNFFLMQPLIFTTIFIIYLLWFVCGTRWKWCGDKLESIEKIIDKYNYIDRDTIDLRTSHNIHVTDEHLTKNMTGNWKNVQYNQNSNDDSMNIFIYMPTLTARIKRHQAQLLNGSQQNDSVRI